MQTEHLIAVNDFCINHNIEVSFISSLQETGLIEIAFVEETAFFYANARVNYFTICILWKLRSPFDCVIDSW